MKSLAKVVEISYELVIISSIHQYLLEYLIEVLTVDHTPTLFMSLK